MRPVYLEFLREDWMDGEELNVVWLNFSLCGTRVAAPNWAAEYSGYLLDPGFQVGGAHFAPRAASMAPQRPRCIRSSTQ